MEELSLTEYIMKKKRESPFSSIKENYFLLLYTLIKNYQTTASLEIIYIIFQLFQLISFTFNSKVNIIFTIV